MGLFSKIFNLCQHKWVELKTIKVYDSDIEQPSNKLPVYLKFILKCEHCGDIRVKKI